MSFPRKQKLPEAVVLVPVAGISLKHQKYPSSAFSMLIHGQSKPWLCFSVHLNRNSWFLHSFFHPDLYFQLEPFYTCGWRHELRWLVQVWQETAAASDGLPLENGLWATAYPISSLQMGPQGLVQAPAAQKHTQGAKLRCPRASPGAAEMSGFLAPCTPQYFVPLFSSALYAN